MNYNQTLFESLAISDSERIHSQMIAWIFGLSNEILNDNIKINSLKKLFNLTEIENSKIGTIGVETEFKKIDILIKTEYYVFVIENKLKSSEHSEQSKKYKKYIAERFPNSDKNYGFLSLIEDKPIDDDWLVISYETLLCELKGFLESISTNKKEHYFLTDYIDTITNLVNAYKSFRKEKDVLNYVFSKKEKKEDNISEVKNRNIEIIKKNRLATIFQKAFFRDLCQEMNIKDYNIDEKNGQALFISKLRCFVAKEKKYEIAFVMQGNTLKISLSIDKYDMSETKDIDLLIESFTETFKGKNGYIKFNEPRTRARISVTKQLDGKKIFDYSFEELSQTINEEIKSAKELANNYIDLVVNKQGLGKSVTCKEIEK